MNKWLKKSLVGILLISFVGVLSFGSVVLTKESHMAHRNCPFAADQQGMCPMMSIEHMEYIVGGALILIGTILTIVVSYELGVILVLVVQKIRFNQLRRKKKISLYQGLFSQGILNPKAP